MWGCDYCDPRKWQIVWFNAYSFYCVTLLKYFLNTISPKANSNSLEAHVTISQILQFYCQIAKELAEAGPQFDLLNGG